MTAYLAVADHFGAKGPEREASEILRLVLLTDQAEALRKIYLARAMPGRLPEAWLVAFEVGTTQDWRKSATPAAKGSALLKLVHMKILSKEMGTDVAESFLKKNLLKPDVQSVRIMNLAGQGVQQGHLYAKNILSYEMADSAWIDRAYSLGGLLGAVHRGAPQVLSKFDGLTAYERAPEPRVVGLQLWAGQAQRNFFQGVTVLNHFLEDSLGVPESAEQVRKEVRKEFSGAFYYPFLAVKTEKENAPGRDQSLVKADQLASEKPEMVAPRLWASLAPEAQSGIRRKSPDFHLFYNPEIPHQTAFEAGKRIYEIGVGDENSLPLLVSLLERTPWDYEMATQVAIVEGRAGDAAAAKLAVYAKFADTNSHALGWLTHFSEGNPQKYEQLKLQWATYNPEAYLDLAYYFQERNDMLKAEKYLLMARGKVDAVGFSNSCGFLVKYYARSGRLVEAEALAKEASETYSSRGLGIYAWLKEYRKDWAAALRIYQAIDERYASSSMKPNTMGFYLRRKLANEGWNTAYEPALKAIFPEGLVQVSLASFQGPPRAGFRFSSNSAALQQAGIGTADVVVALDGIRVNNQTQYIAVRDKTDAPEMTLIVWNGQIYSEIKATPEGRRFGVEMEDYRP